MSSKPHIVYDHWDYQLPDISERSRLHCLEPIGIGTPMVEGLASYLVRLSWTHQIRIDHLIHDQVLPMFEKRLKRQLSRPNYRDDFAAWLRSKSISKELTMALKALTLQEHLILLTEHNSLIDKCPTGCSRLRSSRGWCVDCLKDWRKSGSEIYSPLHWSLRGLDFCPYHEQPVTRQCNQCQSFQPLFTLAPKLDHCFACGSWLGSDSQSTEPIANSTVKLKRYSS